MVTGVRLGTMVSLPVNEVKQPMPSIKKKLLNDSCCSILNMNIASHNVKAKVFFDKDEVSSMDGETAYISFDEDKDYLVGLYSTNVREVSSGSTGYTTYRMMKGSSIAKGVESFCARDPFVSSNYLKLFGENAIRSEKPCIDMSELLDVDEERFFKPAPEKEKPKKEEPAAFRDVSVDKNYLRDMPTISISKDEIKKVQGSKVRGVMGDDVRLFVAHMTDSSGKDSFGKLYFDTSEIVSETEDSVELALSSNRNYMIGYPTEVSLTNRVTAWTDYDTVSGKDLYDMVSVGREKHKAVEKSFAEKFEAGVAKLNEKDLDGSYYYPMNKSKVTSRGVVSSAIKNGAYFRGGKMYASAYGPNSFYNRATFSACACVRKELDDAFGDMSKEERLKLQSFALSHKDAKYDDKFTIGQTWLEKSRLPQGRAGRVLKWYASLMDRCGCLIRENTYAAHNDKYGGLLNSWANDGKGFDLSKFKDTEKSVGDVSVKKDLTNRRLPDIAESMSELPDVQYES